MCAANIRRFSGCDVFTHAGRSLGEGAASYDYTTWKYTLSNRHSMRPMKMFDILNTKLRYDSQKYNVAFRIYAGNQYKWKCTETQLTYICTCAGRQIWSVLGMQTSTKLSITRLIWSQVSWELFYYKSEDWTWYRLLVGIQFIYRVRLVVES